MNGKNEAQDYAQLIADEVRNLETVASGPDSDGYEAALAALELSPDDVWSDPIGAWMSDTALDFSVKIDSRGIDHGWSVTVLRTTGGPHCEVVHDSNHGTHVEVVCYWGGDYGRVMLSARNLTAMLEEIAHSYGSIVTRV